jgi:opacity protein-like surface antigen
MAQAMVQGWYVSGGAGIDWQDNVKEDSTFVGDATFPSGNAAIVAGAFGYRFPDRIRVEGEFAWDRHDLGDAVISAETFNGHVSTWSLMANVAYDFKLGPRWDYTVGAGAGIGNADVSLSGNFGDGSSGSNQGFMWQGFTGIDYWVCDNMTLNVDWRYRELAANDAYDFDSVIPYHLKALHDTALLFSVRWYPWAQ